MQELQARKEAEKKLLEVALKISMMTDSLRGEARGRGTKRHFRRQLTLRPIRILHYPENAHLCSVVGEVVLCSTVIL
jgi:hypothetical protein